MRPLLAFVVLTLTAACQRTPDQQEADRVRNEARQRGSVIENQAEAQGDQLRQDADDLTNQAKQAGGLTGERLKVRADALTKEATEARIKAHKSR